MFFGYLMWMDVGFLAFMLPAIIFSLIAQGMVKSAYRKQQQVRNARGITGFQAAQNMLRHHGIHDVRIEVGEGKLSDHYDPRSKTIRLSPAVYHNASVAAVCIAAHEAGHAAQHAQVYIPLKLRSAIFPVARFGSTLAMPLVFIGLFVEFVGSDLLISLGLALFAFFALFQLVTLPVEFNASRRAMKFVRETDLLYGTELSGARKVLNAAAMTYVAALITTLVQFIRILLISRGRRR